MQGFRTKLDLSKSLLAFTRSPKLSLNNQSSTGTLVRVSFKSFLKFKFISSLRVTDLLVMNIE